jgi:hypothetical protein
MAKACSSGIPLRFCHGLRPAAVMAPLIRRLAGFCIENKLLLGLGGGRGPPPTRPRT